VKESNKYIGKTYPIQDAILKVTGQQQYTGDLQFPHMLHAKILFSPIAHGIIKKIDTSKAETVPGVVKIFTHENSPKKTFSNYIFFVDQNAPKDEYLFADKARFIGDRVAAVVATDPHIAEKAIKLIEVEYEELPVLADPKEALEEKNTKIHAVGNLLSESELNVGDSEESIKKSPMIYKDCISTQKVHHATMENHVCVAEYKPTGEFTIWTPCQSVFAVRNTVGELLDVPYSNVRVIKTTMGGSFGAKQHVILEPLAAFMAMEAKATVKLQFSRTNAILSTITRTATEIDIETGLTEDGKITGCKIRSIVDSGAYAANSSDLAVAMGKKAFRVYRIPNLNYKTKSVYTNTPTAGGCRGWGCPQINTAMEIHMDNIAKRMGMDAIEFRLKNLVYPGDMEILSKISLGNARIRECLIEGAKEFHWEEKRKRDKDEGRYKRGIGFACGGHVNGFFGKIQDLCSMVLKMNEDGTFVLNTGVHDMGCGTLISMAQIVGEVLEVDPKLIKVMEADTTTGPYDMGTFSSRVTYVSGKCAFNVANKVKDMIIKQAGAILGKSEAYLESEDGYVWPLGEPEKKISYRDTASISQVKYQVDIIAKETYSNVSNPGAYAVHFAEVLVDTKTGLVRVSDYLAVHDVGKAINRGMIEGQVQGGVQMGIGYALCEDIKINKSGVPKNDSLKNYTIVNAPDMPDTKVKILEYGGDDGPFGAKSVGEIAVVPVAAAIVNAVNDALDTELCDLPLSPERIIETLEKK